MCEQNDNMLLEPISHRTGGLYLEQQNPMTAKSETTIMMAPKTNAARKRQLLVTMVSQSLTTASTKPDMSCRSIWSATE